MNNTTMTTNDIISNDNQAYWISLVTMININISRYGMGFVILLGNIGSIFSLLTLSRPSLRNNPCAMYFLATSSTQLLAFNFAFMTRILQFCYNIQTVNHVLWLCKLRFYFAFVLVAISRYDIILASIDRYFTSSLNVNYRRWSSKKNALTLIIINTIFWPIMYVHIPIFYEIQNGECTPRNDGYSYFFGIYIAIDSGILPLSLILTFGLLTLRNLHQVKQTINPKVMANTYRTFRMMRLSKKEIQLCRVVINEAFLFLIFNIISPCYLLYRAFTMHVIKSPLRRLIELSFYNILYVFILLELALTFFIYILSSTLFRREFIKLIKKIKRKFVRHHS